MDDMGEPAEGPPPALAGMMSSGLMTKVAGAASSLQRKAEIGEVRNADKEPCQLLLMEEILERLKMLNYEREMPGSFKPLTHTYFALASGNPAEQFHYFTFMFAWLMSLQGQNWRAPSISTKELMDDPNSAASALYSQLQQIGAPTNYPPQKLKQGYGDECCAVLKHLLDAIPIDFAPMRAGPRRGKEIEGKRPDLSMIDYMEIDRRKQSFDEDGDDITKTQETLGKLIKRPKLTEALLTKPPFRFLCDIFTEVTKETGFGEGLFTISLSGIKDKESKVAYLSKMVACVEYALGVPINIRLGKVVAGQWAWNTNAFLQRLGHAATSVSREESRIAVAKVFGDDADHLYAHDWMTLCSSLTLNLIACFACSCASHARLLLMLVCFSLCRRHLKTIRQPQRGIAKATCISWSANNLRLAIVVEGDRVAGDRVHLFDENGDAREDFSTRPADPQGSKTYVVRGIAWSPDSSKLAIAQSDNSIFVYKLGHKWGDKKSICNKFQQAVPITCICWPKTRPNELVFGLADGKMKVGQMSSNKPATLYSHLTSFVVSCCSNPEGTAIISGHIDHCICRYSWEDASRGMAHSELCRHSCVPYALCWGEYICAAGPDQMISFYDKEGTLAQRFDYSDDESEKEFTVAAFDPSGERVVVGSFNRFRTFTLNQLTGGMQDAGVKQIENLYTVTALAWKHDGSRLAVGSMCGAVDLYDLYEKPLEVRLTELKQKMIRARHLREELQSKLDSTGPIGEKSQEESDHYRQEIVPAIARLDEKIARLDGEIAPLNEESAIWSSSFGAMRGDRAALGQVKTFDVDFSDDEEEELSDFESDSSDDNDF